MYFLPIPVICVCIQGYLCEEDPQSQYIIADVQCGTTVNIVLKAISTVTLLLYFVFLYVQQLVYTSCNLETTIPWGSLDHSRGVLRVLWKILIVFSFMLDKQAQFKVETDLACFALGALICHRTIYRSSFFDEAIYLTSSICDFLVTFLFLNMGAHRLFS